MKIALLIALLPVPLISGCAILPSLGPSHDDEVMLTQVQPEPLAACIGQSLGVAPASLAAGYAIALPGTPNTSLTVIRDAVQTVVKQPEGMILPTEVTNVVAACGVKLAAPAAKL